MRKFPFACILLMFGFAVVISVPCSAQVAVTQNRTVTIQVPANIAWTQTGVMLSPGMIVQIEAWGSVEAAPLSDARLFYHQVPPEGRRELHAEKPQPLYPALALLGKIGNGPVFLVGSGIKLYVGSPYGSGQLFLGINDDILANNSGAWSARITILWGEPSISVEGSLLNLECQSELERIQVPATTPQETYSRMVLESGRTYVLQVSGSYSFWSGRTDGVDALYNYLSKPPILWSPLQINGEPLKDLIEAAGGSPEYRSDHIYRIGIVGDGQSLALRINDGGTYSDNSGSLTVQICLPGTEGAKPTSEKEGDPVTVARLKAARDVNKVLWLGVGCCAGPIGILIGYVAPPSPPATAFIGKSPEYVDAYTAAYKAKAKSLQAKYSLYGCVGGTIIWAVGSCITPYLVSR